MRRGEKRGEERREWWRSVRIWLGLDWMDGCFPWLGYPDGWLHAGMDKQTVDTTPSHSVTTSSPGFWERTAGGRNGGVPTAQQGVWVFLFFSFVFSFGSGRQLDTSGHTRTGRAGRATGTGYSGVLLGLVWESGASGLVWSERDCTV